MIALYSDHDLLHSQHYLVIELMHCLALAYSGAKTLTRPQMERTVQLSCHVLEVNFKKWLFTIIQPSSGAGLCGSWVYGVERTAATWNGHQSAVHFKDRQSTGNNIR